MAAIGEEIAREQRLQDVAFWKRAGFDPERGGSGFSVSGTKAYGP